MVRTFFTYVLMFCISAVYAQEICNNGIDDDGDGLVDLNDPDCNCNNVQIASVLPNGSFENYTNCVANEIHCPGWMIANGLSPDYYNSNCNTGDSNTPKPYPDGDAVMGQIIHERGSEYFGSCLTGTLDAGTTYQLTFYIATDIGMNACNYPLEPIDVTLFGAPSCSDMPLPDYQLPDSSTPFVQLGTVNYTPFFGWRQVTIVFTPSISVNAVVIGGPFYSPLTYNLSYNQCRPYFLYDNFVLNKASVFGVNIQASGNYCDGSMVLTANTEATFGVSATYQWYREGIAISGANSATYSINADGSDVGEYKVRVTDGTNCFVSTPFTVTPVTGSPDTTKILPTCSTNGSITVTTVADSYSFDGGGTWQASATKNGLIPGIYSVKIKYGSGCVSGSAAVNLPEPVYGPAPDCTAIPATCGPTGKIIVDTPASEYSFDNGATWGTVAQRDNLPYGTYQVKIKDAGGCVSYAKPVFIDQSYLADPQYTFVPPYCTSNGSITITTSANEYSFDGGRTWQATNNITGISTGTYGLMIRDAQQCISKIVNLTLASNTGYPTYNSTPPGCSGNGSITITSPGVEFSFDNGSTWQSTGSQTNLPAGNYMLLTKDANGCLSLPVSVTLHATPWSLYPAFTKEDPSCEAGSITITTAAEEYSFDNGATWQRSATKTGLLAGNYGLAVKNAQGCISFTKYMDLITVPGTLNDPRYTVNDADCATGRGSITITTAAMEYSFDNGVTWVSTSDSGPLQAGSYRIKIKSAMGCESAAVLVTIQQAAVTPPPGVQPLSLCQGSIATPLTAAGTNLLWYTAQTGGAGNAAAPVPDTSVATTTTYYVSQTVNGCESVRVPLVVTIQAAPAAPVAAATVTYCQGDNYLPLGATGSNLLWYATATGGTASPAAPVPDRIGTNTWYVSQTVNGCESARVAVSAIIKPLPAAPATTSLLTYLQYSQAVSLTATGTSLSWYDENYDELPAAPTPPTTAIGVQLYYVSQTVNGCEGPLAEIRINVVSAEVVITFPPFFTPNGDNFNETWNVQPLRGQRVNTFVFDRYGKLLAQFFSPGAGWDGTYNGKLMPATDYWFLSRYTDEGVEKEFRSHFSLLR